MKAFFLIDTPLAAEIACLLAQQLYQDNKHCQLVAFIMEPGYFYASFAGLVDKLVKEDNINVVSDKDYPKFGRVKMLDAISPDIYICIEDNVTLEFDFLLAAKYHNLPTLRIQPGILGEFPFTWRNISLVTHLFANAKRIFDSYKRIWETLGESGRNPLYRSRFILVHLWTVFRRKTVNNCDKVAVSGGLTKEFFIKLGTPADKIVITGLPRMDSINIENTVNDLFIKKLEKDKKGKKVVLYLPDVAAEHKMITFDLQRESIHRVISSCKQMPEVLLVIKPHPGEDPNYYNAVAKDLNSDAMIYKGTNLYDLIRTSDAVITGISTTGLETLALNKPLVSINLHMRGCYFPDTWEFIPYIGRGVAFGVHHLDELPDAIKGALYDEEERSKMMTRSARFVYDYLYKLDGKASQRVANLIIKMVENKIKQVGR